MLRKGEIVYSYRTDEELEEFEDYLYEVHNEMKNLISVEQAEPVVNVLCGWCDYRNICDKYIESCNNTQFDFIQLNNMSNEDIVNEWQQVKNTKKILEKRERELAAVMLDKIKVQELPVKTETHEVFLRQNARTSYNPSRLSELIPYEDFVTLANLSPTKVKKYLDKNVKVKGLVDEFCDVNYTSAFLALRKRKK